MTDLQPARSRIADILIVFGATVGLVWQVLEVVEDPSLWWWWFLGALIVVAPALFGKGSRARALVPLVCGLLLIGHGVVTFVDVGSLIAGGLYLVAGAVLVSDGTTH